MDVCQYHVALVILTVVVTKSEPFVQAEDHVSYASILLPVLKIYLRWSWVIFVADEEYDKEVVCTLHNGSISTLLYRTQRNDITQIIQDICKMKDVRMIIMCKWTTTKLIVEKMVNISRLWKSSNKFLMVVEEDKIKMAIKFLIHDNNVALLSRSEDQFKLHFIQKYGDNFITKTIMVRYPPFETEIKNSDESFLHTLYQVPLNMNGRTIRVALEKGNTLFLLFRQHSPFFAPASETEKNDSGLDILILQTLGKKLNFTYKVYRPKDHSWGTNDDGMIGMVKHHEVDIAMAGMTITYERSKVVDFSFPYAFERTTFVTRAPSDRNRIWAIFFPFTWQTWLCISLIIVLMGVILAVIENRVMSLWIRAYHKLSLHDSVFYIYQMFLNQGGYDSYWTRTRILIAFWWLFVIIISNGYTGNLMSFLTNPGQVEPIDTIAKLADVVKKGLYSCGTIRSSSDYEMFRKSTGEIPAILLKAMDSNPSNFVYHDKEGLAKCLTQNYAYIAGEVTVKADIEVESKFLFAKDTFQTSGYGIAMTKGFWFRESFDRIILRLGQAGILNKWLNDIITSGRKHHNVDEGNPTALTLPELQGAFSLMILGCCLATAALIIERGCKWKKLC